MNLQKESFIENKRHYYFSEEEYDIPDQFLDYNYDIIQFKSSNSTRIYGSSEYFLDEFNVYTNSFVRKYKDQMKFVGAKIFEEYFTDFIYYNQNLKTKYVPVPINMFKKRVYDDNIFFVTDKLKVLDTTDNIVGFSQYREKNGIFPINSKVNIILSPEEYIDNVDILCNNTIICIYFSKNEENKNKYHSIVEQVRAIGSTKTFLFISDYDVFEILNATEIGKQTRYLDFQIDDKINKQDLLNIVRTINI